MKNLIIALFVLLVSVGAANSQYLNCSTYTANTEDSIAIAGSTDAGSDWFTVNANQQEVWLEVYNGVNWYTYMVDYPMQTGAVTKLKVEMEGSDTTLTVQGYTGGQNIVLPLDALNSTYDHTNVLDITGTTRFRIKFRSFPYKSH